MSLSNIGYSIEQTKNIFDKNNVTINWNMITDNKIDVSDLQYYFEIGEYIIDNNVANDFYSKIKSKLPIGTTSIEGNLIVTISDDINKNFANDDTEADKENGGSLLDKRRNIAVMFVNKLQDLFKNDSITVKFTVKARIEDKPRLYIINIETKGVDTSNKTEIDKDNNIDNTNSNIIPNLTPIDISNLSRNYQFVEILKLGGINTTRFNRDRTDSGDIYSSWIVDTRKHIKSFINRLKIKFPEYNISYNENSKAITPISGKMQIGASNIKNQYQKIKTFESFSVDILDKWNFILGKRFPSLTLEQSELFENNIELLLNYLEQMYGSSALEFDYKK